MQFSIPTFEELSSKEWLLANGLGGYASSSLSGANTRRYNGLLVAALQPPTGRTVMVSKIEETPSVPAAHLDGRPCGRLCGDAPARLPDESQCPLVQCLNALIGNQKKI